MENKKPILVFDLDDTLYSKKKVFLDTLKEIYPNTSFDESSYKIYQEKSDEAFELFSKGSISLEENHFSRVQNTLTALGLPSSSPETMTFKKQYQFMMDHIQLDKDWFSFFDYLSSRASLVLLTNGPTDHQLKKIHSLNLYKWFTSDRIFISEDKTIDVRFNHTEELSLLEEMTKMDKSDIKANTIKKKSIDKSRKSKTIPTVMNKSLVSAESEVCCG